MTEISMVEKVARAIFNAEYRDLTRPWPNWEACQHVARAAIEAMRQPTKEMLDDAQDDALGEDAGGVWGSMIESALKISVNQQSPNTEK